MYWKKNYKVLLLKGGGLKKKSETKNIGISIFEIYGVITAKCLGKKNQNFKCLSCQLLVETNIPDLKTRQSHIFSDKSVIRRHHTETERKSLSALRSVSMDIRYWHHDERRSCNIDTASRGTFGEAAHNIPSGYIE